jgi:hypothetical protein
MPEALSFAESRRQQNQVPVTCQCECLGPTTSSMENLVEVEDDSDIEIEYDIEEEGYLL